MVLTPKGGLDSENPDAEDEAEYRQAADGPAGRIGRACGFGLIDHRVMPVGHSNLLEKCALSVRSRSRQLGLNKGAAGTFRVRTDLWSILPALNSPGIDRRLPGFPLREWGRGTLASPA